MAFEDFARIHIRSGKGGDGHVSFRREKFVAAGGPDGGDGGKGGDVIFEVDKAMNTLFIYKHRYQFKATDGGEGEKRRRHGKNGQDIVLKVPEGTIVREEHTGKVIADMSGDNQRVVILKGGRGGRGNMNFASSTNQAPQYGEPGKPAQELDCTLELKLVADVALVGFPNAGKSTFLARVTNADPKIANYPFTTINPNLGVVNFDDGAGFVIADMPGLIEGASEGVGLGHQFLRHIERTRVLIHLVDAASFDGRDPVEDIKAIHEELRKYNPEIMKKPIVIAANKVDVVQPDENGNDPVKKIRDYCDEQGYKMFPISAVTGAGVRELLYEVRKMLETTAPQKVYYKQEYFPEEEKIEPGSFTITIETNHDKEKVFAVEGPGVEKMLDYTNLASERGYQYFTGWLRRSGVLDALKEKGVKEGDTVRLYNQQFEYYDDALPENEENTETDGEEK